jgi:lipoprotein-releasing system permease protein
MMQRVQRSEGVTQVQPFVLRPGILRASDVLEGVQLKGVEKDFRYPASIRFSGVPIAYPDSSYSQDILLSESTAARLSIKAGDAVRLYFFEPGTPTPRIRKLHVAGLWRTGMEDVDRGFALCDLRLLQRLAGLDSSQISGYQIELADPDQSTAAADRIYREAVQPPLTTKAIPELYAGIFDWLRLQNINVRVLLSIMAAIALINLSAALLILLVDRTKAVGLFKALGQSGASISAVFVWLAGFVGTVGVVAGNVLGLGLCWAQQAFGIFTLPEATYYMRQVPVSIVWWHVALIDVATLLACFLCLWLPALYVRRIHPVRALGFR